ncbi:hypothetical protein [Jiangella alkaliphila]|uniref:Uncharacterized protein n=1 Tax=Jiangella alkaliphila TaxID=419479 RepID=A0A1H2LJA5_9ACTN|nr:hypothetical protein [Jiangella alkaliphila]SDU80835.1 hypothetical protein SAMN04488563_6229 [Jiangella alkaliphila]
MNVKYLAKFGGSALGAVGAARSLGKARREGDKLRMVDAVLSILSVAITIAIVVREIRESQEENKPLVELKGDE